MKKILLSLLLVAQLVTSAFAAPPGIAGMGMASSSGFTCTTYATFNPTDVGTGVSLSAGNLTVTGSVFSWQSARSNIGKSSGKWYWEVTGATGNTLPFLGIGNLSAAITNYVGADANGWSYYHDGTKNTAASAVAYGATFVAGDVIGVALDMGAGTVTFYKNNVSQGVAFSGLTGTLYPMVSVNTSSTTAVMSANFGPTLTYTPPTGYIAGLCN